jgi:NadR type nicotinamide-nucleotide adenylyltransferase
MKQPFKIVLTGAESTGKSTLAQALSHHYQTIWVPEIARVYIENLSNKYTYNDIENIARMQIETEKKIDPAHQIIIFDTWLIITKVWFDFVYGKHPNWLHDEICKSKIDLFLVCDIDMPWTEDPVRENGGENRKILHKTYINELKTYNFEYRIVNGQNSERLANAIKHIDDKILNYENNNRQQNTLYKRSS